MEVDGHPPPDRQTTGRAVHATAEVTVINGEEHARFPKVFREEYMRLIRPQRYDSREDAQVLDEFSAGLRTYLHFYTEREESDFGLIFSRTCSSNGGLIVVMGKNDSEGSTMLPRLCKPFWECSCQGPLESKLYGDSGSANKESYQSTAISKSISPWFRKATMWILNSSINGS